MALEIFGVITVLLYVILEVKENKWLWPLGIISSSIYIWVFLRSKLYADMALQVYYVVVSVYGWWMWTRHNVASKQGTADQPASHKEVVISSVSGRLALLLSAVFILCWGGLFFLLKEFTNSDVPLADSFTTALAFVATWMLTRKYIEQWFLWIIANTVSVGLYIYKGLYPTVFLYMVLTGMAIYGYFQWRRSMQ